MKYNTSESLASGLEFVYALQFKPWVVSVLSGLSFRLSIALMRKDFNLSRSSPLEIRIVYSDALLERVVWMQCSGRKPSLQQRYKRCRPDADESASHLFNKRTYLSRSKFDRRAPPACISRPV